VSAEGKDSEIFAKAKAKWETGDLADARRLMKLAARCGHLPAILEYAYFVEHGIGGKLSVAKSMHWFERAALLGDPSACMRLGRWHFDRGEDAKAKVWLQKVPHRRASLMLVKLHAKSRSVRSTNRAKRLLSIIRARPEELSDAERAEFAMLDMEFSRRNPNAIWAPNNRDDGRRKPARLEIPPSALTKLIQAIRRRLPGSSRPPSRRS
jgi:TPR repeat protein